MDPLRLANVDADCLAHGVEVLGKRQKSLRDAVASGTNPGRAGGRGYEARACGKSPTFAKAPQKRRDMSKAALLKEMWK